MQKDFFEHIFQKQQLVEPVPSNDLIAQWAMDVICLLYPEKSDCSFSSPQEIEQAFQKLEVTLVELLNATKACRDCNNEAIAADCFARIPQLYRLLNTDIQAILAGDPAARSAFEIVRAYPGFLAISFYRMANALYKLQVPVIPRILTEFAHSKTGIDIHPGATIGEHFFIDHGTGVVIGETTIIGDHVKIYQGVTLGALSVDKSMANVKRHPTVEDHVVIYSGATILGGETVIGKYSIIGGNVWLTRSVPSRSKVYHNPEITVMEGVIAAD
jgi:serine O-acetyltransferase